MKSSIIFFIVALFCLQACQGAQSPLYTIHETRYNELVARVKGENFFDMKSQIIKAACNVFAFTCNQTWGLLEGFSTDGDRLDALSLFLFNINNAVANKQKQLIERFNRTEDRQRATEILAKVTDCRYVTNPYLQYPALNLTFSSNHPEDIPDLVKVLNRVSNVTSQLKIAELSVMSRPDILSPEQAMMLFNIFNTYQDVIALKNAIHTRLAGIYVENLITLLGRFSFGGQQSLIADKLQCVPGNFSCGFATDFYSLAEYLHFKSLESSTSACNTTVADRFGFEDHKFALLDAFSNFILDIENKFALVDAFISGCSREKAKNFITKNFNVSSYIFGRVPTGKVMFVVDTSVSMGASFRINGTTTSSRLGFINREITKISTLMDASLYFNVMIFYDKTAKWSTGLVNASSANANAFARWVGQYGASGTKNTYEALQTAMTTPGVQTVYFLTDGVPNSGNKTNIDDIVTDVKNWSRNGNVTVNTVSLNLGTRSDDKKALTRDFMERIATVTGGTVRIFESDI